jgi:hypothetical protein
MKYRVKKDYKIIPKDEILEKDADGKYTFSIEEDGIITSTVISKEILEGETDYFEPLLKVNITNEEVDNSTIKSWKVVFNLKCTEKDLLEVQKVIKEKFGDYV